MGLFIIALGGLHGWEGFPVWVMQSIDIYYDFVSCYA